MLSHCTHARYVWNLAVEQHSHWRKGRKSAPGFAEQCRQLTEARRDNEWLGAGNADVQQQAGAAGRSLYAFSAPLSYEGHENEVESVSSYINVKDGKQNETVAWSRVRYLDYSFLRVDVKPAPKGHHATLTLSGIAETGARVDHFTVARRAR